MHYQKSSPLATVRSSQPPQTNSPKTPLSEDIEAEYSHLCENVKRYLALDVYYIRRLELAENASHTIDRKRAVLVRFKQLKRYEDGIPISAVKAYLFYILLWNITLGVLLNILNGFVSGVGVTLFCLTIFIRLMTFWAYTTAP